MTSQPATRAPADPPATLGDVILPAFGSDRTAAILRAALLVVGGAALTAVAAQLSLKLPWTPVPYTGQTAAVLLVGTALGPRLGAASMALYILVGALGMPVFAGGAYGAEQLLGITGGYLVGFVVAAALVGHLADRRWDRSPGGASLLMALGNLVIYLVGVPVLAIAGGLPLTGAIYHGAVVFLPWDAFKIVVAALALPLAWRLTGEGERRA
jgi:biotin transport system substrate-specific component